MKLRKILMLIVLMMILSSTSVLAVASPNVNINGDEIAKLGETKSLSIVVTSGVKAGVVSGKIEKAGKIEEMNISAKNGWTLTYDPSTGIFNIYKAEGANEEEIISISYKVSNTEGKGTIKLSNLQVTTIDYETEALEDITKEITIKSEDVVPEKAQLTKIEVIKAPTKTSYKEGEMFNKTGMKVKATYSDGTSKEVTNYTYTPSGVLTVSNNAVIISYGEDGITKTVRQVITVQKEVTDDNSNTGNTGNTGNLGNNTDNKNDVDDKNQNENDGKKEPDSVNNNNSNNGDLSADNKDDKKEPVSNKNTGKDNNNGQTKDETTIKDILPKTGIGMAGMYIVIGFVIVSVISYLKYRKYNNV